MKLDLISRIFELAIILYSKDFNSDSIKSLEKLYVDYYARMNSGKVKLTKNVAFIKGPVMMKSFFDKALLDRHEIGADGNENVTVNLRTTIFEEIIELIEKNFKFFDGYNVQQKYMVLMSLIGIDQLLLTAQFEYGTVAVKAILAGKHANKGQWWAVMELNGFTNNSFALANNLLQTTKKSSLSHQLNGASALFPTNMTYARFADIVNGSVSGLSELFEQFNNMSSLDFATKSNLSQPAHDQVKVIFSNYMFHIICLIDSEIFRFGDFYQGYLNFWRYNNSTLHNNMSKIIDVK